MNIQLYLLVVCFIFLAQFFDITCNRCPSRFTIENNNTGKCMDCKICPGNNSITLHEGCKQKNLEEITGQGFAWCTGYDEKSPSCSKLIVKYGNVNCSNGFSVSSKCIVNCNAGYSIENKFVIMCRDDLHWNLSANDLTCDRKGVPDQPTISSSHQTVLVREYTDVTLTCNNKSDLVGDVVYTWAFKNANISNRQKTLTLNPVKLSDAGSYYCRIEDRIGTSSTSKGYMLDVHSSFDKDELFWKIFASIISAVVVTFALLLVIFCGRRIKQHLHCIYMRCVECKSKKEAEIESGGMSSVDSVSSEKREQNSPCMGAGPETIDDPSCPFLKKLTHASSETFLKPPYVKPDNPSPEELLAIANNDQKALRKLLNNADLMKEVKKYLDQQPDRNRDKPTFIQLAEFMRMDVDQINNLIYCCTRESGSPTEELLRLMCMAGQGINNFYSFLEKYPSLHELKESINSSFWLPE